MRALPIIVLSIPVSLLSACANDEPDTDEASASVTEATRITIKTDGAQALVAYRDFTDPTWHLADAKSATKYVARVHGPYLVTAVCVTDIVFNGTVFGHNVNVLQYARTRTDGTLLIANTCHTSPPTLDVSGQMAQSGSVLLGDSVASSPAGPDPAWTFQLPVRKGTYTLYAPALFSPFIVIRRGLQVRRSMVLAPIDPEVEGQLLDTASFTPTNASIFDTQAVVRIQQQSGQVPVTVSSGSPESEAVVPNSGLSADDNQTVSMQAPTQDFFSDLERTTLRASRRPWRIGDDPSFTLPDLFDNPSWALDGNGDNAVSWRSLPPFSVFTVRDFGNGEDPSFTTDYEIDASPSFLATTAVATLTFDTQLPGFQPAWRIPHDVYIRQLSSQLFSDPAAPDHGVVDSSFLSDFVAPGFAARSLEANSENTDRRSAGFVAP